ncbi:Metallo-dependent phosphatase-like protein [Dichotomopilus funicola]|uniref:Metallo-dependent phosphatase-like protein n=1 Tax=Dichotomopilus funicola TaxID=1934379 RepID=A0AAN6ZQU9_9PEZI|nr:Metallo-dependent phosphatase-like protein [Dichotomopilus funicola]
MLHHLNTLLIHLHLRRSSPWSPLTPLDWLLASPLQYLTSLLYRHILLPLRGSPFRPPPRYTGGQRGAIRVVCLSDTHNIIPSPDSVPEGDLLIHCGDMTVDGTVGEIQRQVDWLRGLPHRWKVVVGGNHDSWVDEVVRKSMSSGGNGEGEKEGGEKGEGGEKREVDWSGVEYLCDRGMELEFEGGRKLNVYGWGAVPWCGEGFALQYQRDKHPWQGRIPDETDVLITHTPPRHHLDLDLGCAGLLDEVWRVKPKLHVFGHVHYGHGREAVYYDECQRAYESLMARPANGILGDIIPSARWFDAFDVIWYGVGCILWKWIMLGPGTNNGGLMVNASLMYGDSGRLGNPVTVVDL